MEPSAVSSATGSQVPLLNLAVRASTQASPLQPPPPPLSVETPNERAAEEPHHQSESTYRHIAVLFGAFAANVISFGWVISSGFFFDYYRSTLFAGSSTFVLAWLSGLGFFCLYAVSLPLAIFCSSSTFGPQPTLWAGAFLDLLGLCLLALASNVAEVLVLQAFIAPLGASMVFNASITILSKWFRKNGIRAISFTAAGSGVGGTCFPLLINQLLPEVGYERTILICVVINLALLGICCMTLTMPEGVKHEPYRVSILGLLKQTQYLVTAAGSAVFVCGYYTVMGFLVAIAHERGLPNPSLALSVASACSVPGRLTSGWVAQSRGVYNTLVLFTLVAWVLTIALFSNLTSETATLIYCAVWGFFSSSSISLLPSIIFFHSPLPEISVRIGFAYSMMSAMVLVGPPIGAAIAEATGGYKTLILFCGVIQAVGWVFWVLARYYETGLPIVDIV